MDMQTGLRGLLAPLIAVGLSACGEKVDCNSSTVKDDALEIIQSHLDNAIWYNEMKLAITGEPELENIKTVDVDKDGKHAQCSGTYSVTYNEKPRPIEVTYYLAYLEDKDDTEVKVAVGDVKGGLMGLAMFERPIKNGEEKVYNNGSLVIRNWSNGVQDGVQEIYDRNTEALYHQSSFRAGKKNGPEKEWTRDGKQLISEVNWLNDEKDGVEKRWTSDGQLITDLVWTNGKKNGVEQEQHNGQPAAEVSWKDGKKDGLERKWYRTQLVAEINWVNGEKQGIEKRWASDGQLLTDLVWADGKATGFATLDQEGSIIDGWRKHPYTVAQFKDGLKNGPQKTYGSSRTVREFISRVENFKDDKLDGLAQRFDSRGGIIYELRFSQGSIVLEDAADVRGLKECKQVWQNHHRYMGSPISQQGTDWASWCKEGKFPPIW